MTTLDKPRTGRSLAGRKLTEDELLALPDDGRKYELVDGRAKEVPTGARHGCIAVRLIREDTMSLTMRLHAQDPGAALYTMRVVWDGHRATANGVTSASKM